MADSIPCPKCGRRYAWDGKRCCRQDCRYGSGKKPRATAPDVTARIVGVYPIKANQPVHLVELLIDGSGDAFAFDEVTQEQPNRSQTDWQVAYDERLIEEVDGKARFVFFFHYLDFTRPLVTPVGPLPLPRPKPLPARLRSIRYEAP